MISVNRSGGSYVLRRLASSTTVFSADEWSGPVTMNVKWILLGTVVCFRKNTEEKINKYRQKYDEHIAQFEKERENGEAVIILKWFDAKYPILDKVGLRQ